MGSKAMRRLIYILIASSFVANADSIDDIVNKIKAKRVGTIDKKELSSINSPIPTVVVAKTNSKDGNDSNASKVVMDSETFVLKAIVNNRAYINDQWVKKGQKIGSYTLVDIMDDSVYLKDKSRTKMIFFKRKNSKIKITGR
jgi:hypothetical protein